LSLFPAVPWDAEFPDDRKRKALAIRRAPPTFLLRLAIAVAGIFDERLNEAVTLGPRKNKKHINKKHRKKINPGS
jgi:hypothetical protein